ncbi:pilus assembly protein [Sinirhodobacter sp. WL0062]|uniref:Pilus assembly protein n=1 Tax=Rhodobacter flavimaris TaxID=2907145 RepID=A0ABS8YU99_9RHOB|nr:TadE/TadG family type IV pilus assembly protein [Sinirhodobacter sp. WL0062]MCE5972026.1 pilus assembly protein [Sinirhodobacter sp. WL0062]
MRRFPSLLSRIERFRRGEAGAILVEFAIVLPMMLLVFAIIIEGGRLMWSYQKAAAGVRDATRYLARVAPYNVCEQTTPTVASYTTKLTDIVELAEDGAVLFPSSITINSVTPSVNCPGGTFHGAAVAIVTVTASISITYPFSGIFTLFGNAPPTNTTTISDQSRVYGS